MTCGVLTQANGFHCRCHAFEKFRDSKSKADEKENRETLDFQFESDSCVMSADNGVANIGTGLNGKFLLSIIKNRYGNMKYYLKCGANPNVTTPDKRSALHLAVLTGNVRMVKRLLEAGAFHSALDQMRKTPLHFACSPPQLGAIKTLLEAGANPNVGSQPQSALHCAILAGDEPAVKCLVDAGAHVNVIGFYTYLSSPLSTLGLAFLNKDWRTLAPILLDAGSRLDNVLGTCLNASAFEAILYTSRDTEILKFLIQNAYVPSPKELQKTPFISFRCRTFKRSVVALLLKMVQEGSHDMATVKELLEMLEASGYDLRKDAFYKHIRDVTSRLSLCSQCRQLLPYSMKKPCSDSNRVVRLTASQVDFALRPFHWTVAAQLPTEEMVDFVNGFSRKFVSPREVPRLVSLCRMRVRERLMDTGKVFRLQATVDKLPLPSAHKRFLMLEDYL